VNTGVRPDATRWERVRGRSWSPTLSDGSLSVKASASTRPPTASSTHSGTIRGREMMIAANGVPARKGVSEVCIHFSDKDVPRAGSRLAQETKAAPEVIG
jgi:hypothetical protein